MISKLLIAAVAIVVSFLFLRPREVVAQELKVGSPAPLFTLSTHDGSPFSLESRRGAGWTVLYFFPKAETPGCTQQACAFRDSIADLKALSAEIYGISSDTVSSQSAFHENRKLPFTLLADPDLTVINQYGAKMPILPLAKRWTFIIDKNLIIRAIDQNVDAGHDAAKVAEDIARLNLEQ